MDDVLADLLPASAPAAPLPEPQLAMHEAARVEVAAPVASAIPVGAVLKRCNGALTLIAADDGPSDERRQAAAAVRSAVTGMPDDLLAQNMRGLCARLLAIHPSLLERREDLINPVPEDGAVIAAYIAADRADVLRIGNAAGWHWRRGQLRPMFVSGASVSSDDDTARKDEFGNLVAPRLQRSAPGLGAAEDPESEAVACTLESGDRLLLAASSRLTQLSPAVLAGALALPSCEDAHAQVAMAAHLAGEPTSWPFTVIEVGT
jgi:hypothetical protein